MHGTLNIKFFWDVTQRRLLVSHRRFGKKIGPNIKCYAVQELVFPWTALPLNMGIIGCPETSMANYQPPLRNIPEERRPHSCIFSYICWNLLIQSHDAWNLEYKNLLGCYAT